MSTVINLFPGGKRKALTLSYDDGVIQDKKLVSIFNKYYLKATFNLNSAIQSEDNYWTQNGKTISRINIDEIERLYKGHEIAVHSLTHPHLEELPKEMILNEVFEDRKNLEKITQYPVRGMAYPFGTYNKKVLDVIDSCGIEYSRTVKQHEKFTLPDTFLEWHPTCHHTNPRFLEITKNFLESEDKSMELLYVWGHSYEFDLNENWNLIEEFSKLVSNNNSIWYATNIEIIDYLKALDALKYSADCSIVYNPTAISVWIGAYGIDIEIKPGEKLSILPNKQ
ncbi:polysaccharide deacetylase family protein [Clostridium intestinale]|uniref:Polysaccharide deacetylase n=1 Tax=Clostridium intestinale DSM 6191 TaxID=1121320 RepID=A0A1M5WI66_9CLOT|nr:polysaccharide deacetylase family protein [Clostridium intestinale]SHH87182.1 Polysaccharide deacetylase [Clostridium intestinale DSM 6191]